MFEWWLEFNRGSRISCKVLEVSPQKILIVGEMPLDMRAGKHKCYLVGIDTVNKFEIRIGTPRIGIIASAGESFAYLVDVPKGLDIFEKIRG